MNEIVRLAIAPALLIARLILDEVESRAPRPVGPPHAHSPGTDSCRILIVGNGEALGVGVRSHDLALSGALSRAVSRLTGGGVDVDLVGDARLSLRQIVDAVRQQPVGRYDCIVLVTGGDEAIGLLSLPRWRKELTRVLADLRSLIGPTTPVVVTGVPANHLTRALPAWVARLADAHAAQLDRISLDVCAKSTNVRFVALPATRPGAVPARAAEEFASWACLIAPGIASDVASLTLTDAPVLVDEGRRQSSVDQLELANGDADPRLQHIADMARRAFGTETALFTVLDHTVQLHVARSGSPLTRIARSDSFCQYTILERGGMIVEDARLDERFRENPLVTGEPRIRFYAGFPVDSPDGERVGALCIFDPAPRQADQVDLSLLRELAHLVQRELWRYLPETAASDSSLRPLARSWTLPRPGTLPRPAPFHRVVGVEADGA